MIYRVDSAIFLFNNKGLIFNFASLATTKTSLVPESHGFVFVLFCFNSSLIVFLAFSTLRSGPEDMQHDSTKQVHDFTLIFISNH